MDFSNPLEVILAIFLTVLSVWIIEKVISGAFKTIVLGFLIFGVIFLFSRSSDTNQKLKRPKPLPHFTSHDLVDYESFKKKLDPYTKETVKDIKYNFEAVKKSFSD